MTTSKIKYTDYQKAIIFCKLLLRTHEQFDSEIKIIIDGLNLYEFEEDAIEQDLKYWSNKAIELEKENEILKKELNEYGKENKNNKNT
jgi:hypothetical protein